MGKATLIIMAGGLGSRFGGLKQLEKIGANGEKIIDYSIYDAKRAGFDRVVFVIKEENLEIFKQEIGDRVSKKIKVDYAFQSINDLPDGMDIPVENREKPWGTGHAVWCARNIVKEPFAVINADDYYGPKAFKLVYDYLMQPHNDSINYCMAGYVLKNTLTDNGSVSRGVCKTDSDGFLYSVTEHKTLTNGGEYANSAMDDGTVKKLPLDSVVSMNFWGFTPDFFNRLDAGLRAFTAEVNNAVNPLKAEYFLPEVADKCIRDGYAKINVLVTDDRWYGVTYREDKESVSAALKALVDSGLYPAKLWD